MTFTHTAFITPAFCLNRRAEVPQRKRTRAMRLFVTTVAMVLFAGLTSARADTDADIERLVSDMIRQELPRDGIGGAAVAVRIGGRTLFLNFGMAAAGQPMTSDALFNLASLRKVFEAVVIADAINRAELRLSDRVADDVSELARSHDLGHITYGQLATHTSGLLLPQDHPPWPNWGYTMPEFIAALNSWRADKEQAPGEQHVYTHAGYVLLQLALERHFGMPIAELLDERVLHPLQLTSTVLPERNQDGRAALSAPLLARAVQGYAESGKPKGEPGDQQTYYHFPGTGQMFSSARDLAAFVAANLGEAPVEPRLQKAMLMAQKELVAISPRNSQALAWEVNHNSNPPIVEKNGGLDNASTYFGMIPKRKIGIVILINRGENNPAELGRRILRALAAR